MRSSGEAGCDEESRIESHEASTMRRPAQGDSRAGLLLADRYRVMERLGKGGMAAVYRAVDRIEGTEVAVKFLDRRFTVDPDIARRCHREARTMAELESRHIPRALLVGTTPEGEIFLVMEFLRGRDLDLVLVQEGALPWRRAVTIGLQLCGALAAAHARNIIHRDVKPSNCFLVEGEVKGEDFVKLIDFGIAKDLEASGEQTGLGLVLGTPGYVAPELLAGEARPSPATDVYGLGVTIYKLMTGRLPWTPGSAGDVTYAQMHVAPRPLRDVAGAAIPVTVEAAVMQAFERNPLRRFRSVDDVMTALRQTLEEPRAIPPSGSEMQHTPVPVRARSWQREAAIVAATAAVLFGLAWSLTPADRPGRRGSARVPLAAVRPPPREVVARAAVMEVPPKNERPVVVAGPSETPVREALPAELPVEVVATSAPAPAAAPVPASARPFSAGKVRAELDRRVADLRVCVMPGTDRGRFTLAVGPDGSIADIQATPASFRQCVSDQLDGVTFPPSDGGGEMPYSFRSSEGPKPSSKSPAKNSTKDDAADDLLPVGGK